MTSEGRPPGARRSVFTVIYDWINTCDSIPNFDAVLFCSVVFLAGCLLIGFTFLAGHFSQFRRDQHKPAGIEQRASAQDVPARFGNPRRDLAPGYVLHAPLPHSHWGEADAAVPGVSD